MNAEEVTVRAVQAEDWPALRRIRLEMLADTPLAYGSTLAGESAFGDEVWQQRAARGRTFFAESAGAVVGTATWLDGAEAEGQDGALLVGMYVAPAARGARIAHRLIDAVVISARAAGFSRLLLDVTEVNEPARRSYLAYGFIPTGHVHPLDHRPDIAEHELALDLATETAVSGGV